MIVLNEHEWAEEMISSKTLGKKPFETLSRVGRYYLDKGRSKQEARFLLDAFLLQCDPSVSLAQWTNTLDAAFTRSLKYNAIIVDYIDITDNEMKKIASLEGVQLQRLAFTLLCLAKYWMLVNEQNNYWVCCKDSEIMKMANISTSIKRQGLMYHTLFEAGLVQFSKKIDNTKVRVLFAEDGESAVRVTDMRNLGYQYMMALGDDSFFQCQNCGLISKRNTKSAKEVRSKGGRPQKYCKECASAVRLTTRVNAVMRT